METPSQVGIYEAKTHLSELIDRVEAGEVIEITRHGKPVARLGGVEPTSGNTKRPANATEAIARIRENRARIKARHEATGQPPITVDEILGWIKEGRRY